MPAPSGSIGLETLPSRGRVHVVGADPVEQLSSQGGDLIVGRASLANDQSALARKSIASAN